MAIADAPRHVHAPEAEARVYTEQKASIGRRRRPQASASRDGDQCLAVDADKFVIERRVLGAIAVASSHPQRICPGCAGRTGRTGWHGSERSDEEVGALRHVPVTVAAELVHQETRRQRAIGWHVVVRE